MNKIQKFALTLSIALAAALTFNCSSDSSDDDDNVGGGLSDLYTQPNQQVYDEDGEAFNINGDVVLIFDDYFEDYDITDMLPAGKIENGKITLNLPSSIDSKYLKPWGDVCKEEGVNDPCINDLKNTLVSKSVHFLVNISDKGLCQVGLGSLENSEDHEETSSLLYSEGSGKLKFEKTHTYDDHNYEYTYNEIVDLNLSKGWNTFYFILKEEVIESTNPNVIKGTLKWQLSSYCH